mgnify:CR=1 FL=1
MTGSRTNPALPQRICTITAWRRTTTTQSHQTPTRLIFRHPPSMLHRVRTEDQDRSSSLRCGRCVLTPGPYPMLPTRRPKASKTPGR